MQNFVRPLVLVGVLSAIIADSVLACPLCGPASPTLAEQIASADVVVMARFAEGEKPNREEKSSGKTFYTVVEVTKDGDDGLAAKDGVSIPRYRHGELGDLVLMFGQRTDEGIRWNDVININDDVREYMKNAPPIDAPTTRRLAYCINFLEHPNSTIATDAYSEFAIAPYEDIVPLRPLMKPDQLREWLANSNEPADRVVRVGLYGLMLGLSGDKSDADFLEQRIYSPKGDYELGRDGMTGGFLLLTGDAGLKKLASGLLSDPDAEVTQIFPVLEAMRFAWTFGEDQIPRESLIKTMRVLLKRSDLADLVMTDLARWKDWDSMERIVSLYSNPKYDSPAIRRSILRYLLSAEQSGGEKSPQVLTAQKHLKHFREIDPRTAQQAERYFFE